MDLLLNEYTNDVKEPVIDFALSDEGELTLLTDTAEEQQRAIVSAFTQRGSIPQLPDVGVQWAELLTGEVGYAEINSQLLSALHDNAGTFAYTPNYTERNGKLIVTINEVQ